MQQQFIQSERQIQTQTLSPALIRSMQLLSLPYPSLAEFLGHRALENPFLEFNDTLSEMISISETSFGASRRVETADDDPPDPFSRFPGKDPLGTLHAHLRLQLCAADLTETLYRTCLQVIDFIDDNGYCRDSASSIASLTHQSVSSVQEALSMIKTFSPRGVGAADLRECLLLQADPAQCDMAILRKILDGPTEKIAQRDYAYFSAVCHTSRSQIRRAFSYLTTLTPNPGECYAAHDETHYLFPEIEIEIDDGKLSFRLCSGCSLLHVNQTLYTELTGCCDDPDALSYMKEQYENAVSLIEALTLRRNAMERLLVFLLQAQRDFFLFPDGVLKPMTMKQAAAEVHMHPSTISRCVNDRYIRTRHGTLAMRDLFSGAIATHNSNGISTSAVKKKIHDIIRSEDEHRPCSDQTITEYLSADGITISRRTVAKYRDQMGIAGSSMRKRKG